MTAKTWCIIGTWAFFSLEQTGPIFFFDVPCNRRELLFLRNSKRHRGIHSPCTTISGTQLLGLEKLTRDRNGLFNLLG